MRLWVRGVVFHLVKLPYIHFAEITKDISSSAILISNCMSVLDTYNFLTGTKIPVFKN